MLAERFKNLKEKSPVILAIPRGGVEVGYELSLSWNAPLDLIVPRKIGAPFDPEMAIGAITEDGQVILDERFRSWELNEAYLRRILEEEKREIQRRLALYRGDLPPLELKDQVLVITDDGIATGSTMKAAVLSVKAKSPKEVIIVVPVASPEAVSLLEPLVSGIYALDVPSYFMAVGQFYQDFSQTSDETVCQLLRESRKRFKERNERHA
ncbi:MAG: phosphoribosyltransferase [bacterium]